MHKVKIIFIVLVIAFLFCNIFNSVYAGQVEEMESPVGKPISKVTTSISPGDYKPDELSESETTISFANKIIGAFQIFGSITSVLALSILGVKFMLGSVEEKADYKQWMGYYVVGAILVFAISNISAAIYSFMTA